MLPANVRAIWLTARRAGLQRSLQRLQRMARLRIVDPYWGERLYPKPMLTGDKPATLTESQSELLQRLAVMRAESHLGAQWNQVNDTLQLLNQAPFSLQPPVEWQARPVPDLLWAFQLHGWDWAWPALCDEEGRHGFLALWQDWLHQVPMGRGVAWEPYPTSRRLIAWSAAWHFLERDPQLAAAIGQQAAFLADHLERDLDNNHLVANAKALAWVGLLLPHLPNATQWRQRGLECLWQTLESQVRNDGSHFENSSGYHMAVWLDGLETALLAGASGEWVPETAWQALEKMGDFALALRRPDGRLPMLNDSIEDEPVPAESLFALAADAFDRSDLAWAAGHPEAKAPQQQSVAFPDAGYAILRAGVLPHQLYLLFDAGSLGPLHCPGHGHADALSFELWSGEQALIIDPGTYQYPAGQWRDYFRSTAAHSTATVDGQNQSVFAGPFRVADMARAQLTAATLAEGALEVAGEHDGYMRLADPVVHQRRLRVHGAEYITITDSFIGEGEHDVVLHFHLTPCTVEQRDVSSAQAIFPGDVRLDVNVSSSVKGTLLTEEGWLSRSWYEKEPTPVLAYRVRVKLPTKITTHLVIKRNKT